MITNEPKELIEKCYPQLIENYKTGLMEKKAQKIKRPREPKKPKKDTKNKKITDFLKLNNLEESFEKMEITPKRKKGPQFDKVMTTSKMDRILNGSLEILFDELSPNDFPVENDISASEMSLIINEIVSRKS